MPAEQDISGSTPLRTLIVEDSIDDTELILRELHRHGYRLAAVRVDTRESLLAALESQDWDVVICDYSLPRFNGLEALRIVQEKKLDVPFIVVSGSIGEEIAVQAMKGGAHDYIMKDRLARLAPAIEREIREAQVRRERRRAEERARYLAYFDPLTGLPNLMQLQDRLEQQFAGAGHSAPPFALLMLNLIRFREFNETLGHSNGDLLLQQVAKRLCQPLDGSSIAARLGGDEFALLLHAGDRDRARATAITIQKMLEPPFEIAGFRVTTGAKIGVALAPEHGANARALLQRADVALSIARQRDTSWFIYDPAYDPSSPQRLLLASDLRIAVGANRLMTYFQPKLSLHSGKIDGMEALVRWAHPDRGLIPPEEFVPLAERTGLIGAITRSMLQTALEHARDWRRRGWSIRVAVNLSVKNVTDRSIVHLVDLLLARETLDTDLLELEITESALMEDPHRSVLILQSLSDMGIRLSIDDFGTGYSSLAHLKRMPVDAIKIDKAFVVDMLRDDDTATIVRSTIELAHGLGLKAVAEGVESKAILRRLSELGCDEVQGHFIAQPMPPDGVNSWLASHAAG